MKPFYLKPLLAGVLLLLFIALQAQKNEETAHPTLVVKAVSMKQIPSLASQLADGTFIPATNQPGEVNPKRRDGNLAVPGKGLPNGPDPLWHPELKNPKPKGKEPILTFEAAAGNATPTDPTGAVGPDHFVNSWNSSFRIWDKSGNSLTPAASLATIFPGETAGDPIVMYDQIADRFIITEFTFQNGFLVAISQGSDPVNSGWYTWFFPTNSFPDYPKYSLWSDGYYITANKNSSTAGFSEVVFALERDAMLNGDPDAQMIGFPLPGITTSGFYSPLGFNVVGTEMPPAGNAPIVYMQDDVWSGVSSDHLKIWNINVDWETPGNSTISTAQEISVTPFDGLFDGGNFSNLPQPSGPDIDALQATIMYMANYRRFTDHNSVVLNFVVDLDGGDDHAGIRWYELRQDNDGDPWSIYQESTYSQPDGHSAFSGNMCIDAQGNIALAYTVVSNSQYPSLRYTGRLASDPLNQMIFAEESIAEGTSSDPSFRYGDYSQMTIDPEDDLTFWSIGEYFLGGPRRNHVGVFKLAPNLANDVGIVSIDEPVSGVLSANETITVTVRNYGFDDQANIPVTYQINDGDVITETFAGPVPANTTAQFSFATTADLSVPGAVYQIHTATALSTDENPDNDTLSAYVTHLFANDVGISSVVSPVSGTYLSDNESVTVTLVNSGVLDQTGFPVTFVLDNNTPVTEQFTGTLAGGSSMDFTFSNTADLSTIGDHLLEVYTGLNEDQNNANDTLSATIVNSLCQPQSDCSSGVTIYAVLLNGTLNTSGCDPNGYGDYTDLNLWAIEGWNDITIATLHGDVHVKMWVDMNDNFLFDTDEVIIEDYVIAPGQGSGNFSETISYLLPAGIAGEHMMRLKVNYLNPVPSDPCAQTVFGETEDYFINIGNATGLEEPTADNTKLELRTLTNNHFEAHISGLRNKQPVYVTVVNTQGKTLIYKKLQPDNGNASLGFNMSYAPKGVYLLKMGQHGNSKITRFVVQ
ncbi:MAG: hypothetical protein Kow00127_14820 [Bacteroidales bacterium]